MGSNNMKQIDKTINISCLVSKMLGGIRNLTQDLSIMSQL